MDRRLAVDCGDPRDLRERVTTEYVNHSAEAFSEHVVSLGLTFLVSTMLYALVPSLLLARRISLLRLLPSAALMGVGSVGLSLAGQVYLPRALKIGAEHFGSLGLAFTLSAGCS